MKCINCNQEAVEGTKFCEGCWKEIKFEMQQLAERDEEDFLNSEEGLENFFKYYEDIEADKIDRAYEKWKQGDKKYGIK